MFLWHVGGATAIFRLVFRDPKIDLRFLALGALLPNLIDKPLTLLAADLPPRSIGHTLILSLTWMGLVLLLTRRGRRRRRWMAVAIGMLSHLVLDAMWLDPETLFWPVLGQFPEVKFDLAVELSSPLTWVQEAVGLAYLVYLAKKAQLSDPDRRAELVRTGRIRM